MVRVDVLFFEGCPNHAPTAEIVREVVSHLGVDVEMNEIPVESVEDAETHHFLGSPSVHINGRDIEPGAEQRADYALSCRMYGDSGVPPRDWLVAALTEEA